MRQGPFTASRPIRVLFIVDSLYWVIGNFSHQITKNNPELQAVTCSQFAIRKTAKRFGSFPNCFDVIHFLRSKTIPSFWGILPIVTTFHHLEPATTWSPFHQSNAVMTVSSQWHEYLVQQGIPESHLSLVPYGVDTDAFHPPNEGDRREIKKALNFSHEAFVLGFSARRMSDVDDRKGVTRFLQSLKKIRDDLANLSILIVGPGWQALARDIRRLGVVCIQAPYEITHERIAKFYRAMDLFWVTSRIEGGPVPLLEAMASGIPCISTPVGAARDLIKNNKNGFVVPFKASNQFVDRTLELARNQNLRHRIGREARKTILGERQWSQAQKKLRHLYSLALHNFYKNPSQNFSRNRFDEMYIQNQSRQESMTAETFYSQKIQSWIQACEQINGFRMMVEMREWKIASQFGLRALHSKPFDPSLWKEIIRVLKKNKKLNISQPRHNEQHALLTSKPPF